MALTDAGLKKMLKGHDDKRPRKVADRDGLAILWRPSGKVSFVYRYRYNGRQTEVKLGEYTNNDAGITLADARRKAEQCRAWLNEDRNPATMLRLAKQERLNPVTVQEAIEHWIENYGREHRVNIDNEVMQLEKWVFSVIGDLPLTDCDTRQWLSAFDPYRKAGPVSAGTTFQLCKQALKYCRARGFAESHALDNLTLTDVGKLPSKRDRVLSMAELRDVQSWTMQPTAHPYYGPMVRLMLAFGCRGREIRLSKVEEWNLVTGVWTVPKANSKSGMKITRPIPEVMMPFIHELVDHVQGNPDAYLLGVLKKRTAISSYANQIRKVLSHKDHWAFHDLRRSLATHLNEVGIAPHVVEVILGHTLPGVMAHYVHTSRLSEQRAALDLWQNMLNGVDVDNVVEFRGQHG